LFGIGLGVGRRMSLAGLVTWIGCVGVEESGVEWAEKDEKIDGTTSSEWCFQSNLAGRE